MQCTAPITTTSGFASPCGNFITLGQGLGQDPLQLARIHTSPPTSGGPDVDAPAYIAGYW